MRCSGAPRPWTERTKQWFHPADPSVHELSTTFNREAAELSSTQHPRRQRWVPQILPSKSVLYQNGLWSFHLVTGLYASTWPEQQMSLSTTASMGMPILRDPEWDYLKVLRVPQQPPSLLPRQRQALTNQKNLRSLADFHVQPRECQQ